jgi:uroporphyrinogen decarboxylase
MNNPAKSQPKLLRTLAGEANWPPPVWLMRQAGRYLPEYRALRSQAGDFISLCTTPELAAEVTLQPVRRFGMDGAILFSDILMLPWALGHGLRFAEGEGPVLPKLSTQDQLTALDQGRVSDAIQPILETIRLVRAGLPPEAALIGFAGSPFTVACYMVEGGGSRDFVATRTMAYGRPDFFHALIDILVEASVTYLSAQADAGAQALMLFDSWSGVLPPAEFARWVVEPTRRIVAALAERHPTTPIIGFPRLAGTMLPAYLATGVAAVGLDTAVDLGVAASLIPAPMVLQGNLDPMVLLQGGRPLTTEIDRIALALRGRAHIFNLGHGIVPQTPPDHVADLVDHLRRG